MRKRRSDFMDTTALALLIFIILAYGVWGFALKFAVDKIGLWTSVAIGFGISVIVSAVVFIFALSKGGEISLNPISIGLSVSVVLATLALFASYVLLEKNLVSTTMAFIELYVVIVVLLGVFVLKEQLTITQTIGIVLAIAAAILLSI